MSKRRFLSLDSTGQCCSVALWMGGGADVISRQAPTGHQHSQALLPLVIELLAEARLRLEELGFIAFGRGPGSFTGIRVCASVVQGLALGGGLQVLPISSLAALAGRCLRHSGGGSERPILAVQDARMGDVHWGLYSADHRAGVIARVADRLDPTESLRSQLSSLADESGLLLCGDGVPLLAAGQHLPATVETVACGSACAADVAWLAARCSAEDEGLLLSAEQALPSYMRADSSWQKRVRRGT